MTQWTDASDQTAPILFFLCTAREMAASILPCLIPGQMQANETVESGHTWYLVQSKYGTAFSGVGTLLAEGQKVIDTLDRQANEC